MFMLLSNNGRTKKGGKKDRLPLDSRENPAEWLQLFVLTDMSAMPAARASDSQVLIGAGLFLWSFLRKCSV